MKTNYAHNWNETLCFDFHRFGIRQSGQKLWGRFENAESHTGSGVVAKFRKFLRGCTAHVARRTVANEYGDFDGVGENVTRLT